MNIFCFKKTFSHEEYKMKIQDSIKKEWNEDAIEIEELIYNSYDEKTKEGVPPIGIKNILIFVDKNLNMDWIVNPNNSDHALSLVSRAMTLESLPHKHLPKSEIIEFKKIIGYAILAGIRENEKDLEQLEKQAHEYHQKRIVECSRKWTLLISLPISLFVYGFILVSDYLTNVNCSLYAASLSGLIGAFLSLTQGMTVRNYDSSSGLLLHFLEVITKLTVGAISGFMILFIGKTILSPDVLGLMLKDINGFITLSFVAGFSERLIPRMISTYESKIGEN